MNRQLRYNNNIANPLILSSINPIINPLYWFGESGVQYILDMYSASELGASYALRKINDDYLGSCIRVRRSSDNAEQDIGYNGDNLDITSLLAFVTTNSGYVVTWYDSTGNGNHLTQSTAANQPRIVNAGILDRDFDTVKANTLWPTWFDSGLNIFTNGNFVNTTGWTAGGGVSFSIADNTGMFTSSGVNGYISKTFTSVVGNRYFVRAKIKSDSALVKLRCITDVAGTGSGNYETLSQIITATATTTTVFVVDTRASGWTEVDVQEVFVANVTNYGQPTLVFDGSNDCLINTANQASIDITSQPLYLNSVFSTDSAISASGNLVCKNVDSTSNVQYQLVYENAVAPVKSLWNYLENTARAKGDANSVVAGIQQIGSSSWNTDTSTIYKNGELNGTTATYSSTLTSRSNLYVGCRGNTSGTTTQFLKGKISEIHIAKLTDQAALIADQKTYYSIT